MALRVRLSSGVEEVFELKTMDEYWSDAPWQAARWIAVDYRYEVTAGEALTVTRDIYGWERDGGGFKRVFERSEDVAYYRPHQWDTVRKD